jgi:dTDP-glucose 4,6-dehydratase
LTRDPDAFKNKAPHLANSKYIMLWEGDILSDFKFPRFDKFSHVIHAAHGGIDRVLDEAVNSKLSKFLLLSSGAVYGNTPHFKYAVEKSYAEAKCLEYADYFDVKIARCFSFIGPYMPLDNRFAIGKFIGDGLRGVPVTVSGTNTPLRTYMYSSDMAIWLWSILIDGESSATYDVGGRENVSIEEAAEMVALHCGVKVVRESKQQYAHNDYIPNTYRTRKTLGLDTYVNLDDAILKTLTYYWRSYEAL